MSETTEINFSLETPDATAKVAADLGRILRAGDFIALWGDLGAGKTTFARALIQSLNPAETEVPSPTFTLVQEYTCPQGALLHFDLYRLGSIEDIYDLGWEEARQGICVVEWPERLGSLLPAERFDITLGYGTSEEARRLSLRGQSERVKEMTG